MTTAGFIYVRLHGPTEAAYRGSYPDATLGEWKARLAGWKKQRKDVLVYFDNDEKGFAAADALRLKEMITT